MTRRERISLVDFKRRNELLKSLYGNEDGKQNQSSIGTERTDSASEMGETKSHSLGEHRK